MKKKRHFFGQLLASERISLTDPRQVTRIRNFILVFSLLILAQMVVVGILFGLELISLIWLGSSTLIALLLIRYIQKNIYSTVIKGGTLILTDLQRRSLVTSIRSVSFSRTYLLGNLELTRIRFYLDGRNRTATILNSTHYLPFKTDSFLKKAKLIYKKQKANL